jgi:hypothetical protein
LKSPFLNNKKNDHINYKYKVTRVRNLSCQNIWCCNGYSSHHQKNAYLLIEDNLIADFGSMDNLHKNKADKTIDATGK